ncbi:MAG: response regulator transcription factor [Bacteroidetes bacterium]|nr:response regulator transcription factor [Bacteroidota bacterium]
MKILIIEDEQAAARRLSRLIAELLPDAEIIDQLETISDTVKWLMLNQQPNLILMDIHLADGSCFEIFKQIKVTAPVIFITAYDQYAIQAFKVNSIDYLLKPVKKEELQLSLQKWKASHKEVDFSALMEQMIQKTKDAPQRFVVKYGQFLKAIDSSEIALFYAEDKTINILTFDKQTYPIDFSLDKIQEMLDSRTFFRISRGIIINYKAIGQMFTHFKGRIKIESIVPSHLEIYVSADRASAFKLWLSGKSEI